MKRFLFGFILIFLFSLSLIPQTAKAQNAPDSTEEPFAGAPLCLPDIYQQEPANCLALGPSQTLSVLASKGISYPLRALPAVSPDPQLSVMEHPYLKVTDSSIPLYSSFADAANRNVAGYLEGGMKYLVNIERVDTESGVYYQLPSGMWIVGGEAEAGCCIQSGRFQGLLFRQTPRNGFGWILTPTPVKSTPGFDSPNTGRELYRENLVQTYAVEDVGGTRWVMIGIDEWIEDRVIARVTPNPVRPPGVDRDRWIEINLDEQIMAVYDHDRMVFATAISTGVEPFFTRPGLFPIYIKKEFETMRGTFEVDRSDFYYLEYVPWTMYFDEARALHGAYWHTLFGYPQSHGCVNLSPGDSHWLFDWAQEGDWVYVWDPSGKTPTDPSLYTPGGA